MIRVAILGAGIGREHLEAYRTLPEFDVAMVVDQNRDRIEEIRDGDSYQAVSSIDTALTDPTIDVIDICLPPPLHVSTTLAALAAGKHVVCEKPPATSMADVARIEEAAAHSGKRVFPVFQYRWGRSLAQLRGLMAAGLTGAPHVGAIETHWSRDAQYYDMPWRGTWAGEQGGAVLGHSIHNHDLMTHLMGPVAAVSAMTATRVNRIETEDCAAISFQMVNGSLCTSSITLGAGFNRTRIRVVFEHLTATSGDTPYAPGADPWEFVARDPARQDEIDACVAAVPDEPRGFWGYFTEIGKALTGQPNAAVTLQDGAASVALVTAVYHAARTGARVDLPLPASHPLYHGWQPALPENSL